MTVLHVLGGILTLFMGLVVLVLIAGTVVWMIHELLELPDRLARLRWRLTRKD